MHLAFTTALLAAGLQVRLSVLKREEELLLREEERLQQEKMRHIRWGTAADMPVAVAS